MPRTGPAALALVVLAAGPACGGAPAAPDGGAAPDAPSPGDAGPAGPTAATRRAHLYAGLLAQMDVPEVLFGQQRFNLTGVDPDGTQWLAASGAVDRSDARTVTGQHPAVLGLDAWDLAIKPATWTPTPAVHAEAAHAVAAAGGVVTIEWHQRGCGADTFDVAGNEACLCRLANDDALARSWLLDGQYARFADALVATGLDQVPLVFRPLHEHTGGWFWWGKPQWSCAAHVTSPRFTGAAAYARVFRTIVHYLRVERGLANLLIAYSPAGGPALVDDAAYLEGYPGDAYVDVLGTDLYYQAVDFAAQSASFRAQLQTVTRLARARGKVAALTEVGNTQLAGDATPAQSRWYQDHLLPLLASPGVELAYALTWENRTSGAQQFWVPYPGHPGVADFQAFEASGLTSFLGEVPPLAAPPAAGYPACLRCDTDPDGDRWGWEDARSCRVGSWCLAPEYPPCAACASDPDGDGWGWEDSRSCEVLATCQ